MTAYELGYQVGMMKVAKERTLGQRAVRGAAGAAVGGLGTAGLSALAPLLSLVLSKGDPRAVRAVITYAKYMLPVAAGTGAGVGGMYGATS